MSTEELHRGDLLTESESLKETNVFDAQLRMLGRKAQLEDALSVELLTGTAERRARVALIGSTPIESGGRGFGRVHVEGPPLPLLPGDRFVLRGFARDAGVGSTLGGGIVLDVAPPHRRRRDPELHAELERLARGEADVGLEVRVLRAGLEGVTLETLALETGLSKAELDAGLARLVEKGAIVRLDAHRVLGQGAARRLMDRMRDALEAFHEAQPHKPGMSRAALRGSLPENVSNEAGMLLLTRLNDEGEIEVREEIVSRTGFESRLDAAQTELADRLRGLYKDAALDAPALRAVAEDLGADERTLREVAYFLERQDVLVAAPDELFFDRVAVLALIERVVAHFETSDEIDTQTLKNLIGTSRRTAMPLMALLDDLQITRRDGSLRRLISSTPRA